MISLALHYAKSGWPVFPLHGKVPMRGSHGHLDATLEPSRIEALWAADPGANIGIATGRRAGLLVIDIDPRKTEGWLASVHELALPLTFTIRTWSGGYHLYFSFDGDPRISIGADLLPGIDWRGNGGYVVGAGSVVNGVMYQISRNFPIAPAPVTLIDRLLRNRLVLRQRKPIKLDDAGRMVIPESRRNDTLMRIACGLRRWGVDETALLGSLRAVNALHCTPALADDELRLIAGSAAKYPPAGTALA